MRKNRFTIGKKIGTGFGVVIFFIIVIFSVTIQYVNTGNRIFEESKELNERITNVETPSLNLIIDLNNKIRMSKELITKWATVQLKDEDQDKAVYRNLLEKEIPVLKKEIYKLLEFWPEKEQDIMRKAFKDIDDLFELHQQITTTLVTFTSYEDASLRFLCEVMVETDGEIDVQTKKVLQRLEDLKKRQELRRNESLQEQNVKSEATMHSFQFLFFLVILSGIALVVGSMLIASFTTRSIVRPIQNLKRMLLMLGRGVIPKHKMDITNDEIGDMSIALNSLVEGFKRTTDFSNQVGIGNFSYKYEPLSDEDVLGHALLKMRDDLAENERILEQKVIERTEEVVRQKEEIEKQRQKLEELYKDVTDSIRYAKRLQDSILPPDSIIRRMLPQSFVLFKPKDIVSGDFYWFFEHQDKILFAAVDCTGHGVPGAFMSLVGANALNQAVKEHELIEPARILEDLNKLSSEALNKNADSSVRDGMDLALCAFHKNDNQLEFAGANNPLYVVRDKKLIQVKPDKFAIGAFEPGTKNYTNHRVQLQRNDVVYIFSDGFADQFGGDRGKKFMYKQFKDLLVSISHLSMAEQRIALENAIESWRGSFEQIDDILVIGVKVA
jgi:serine phosphatase RsbU (regulator of sigma subunit)/HAMP domain-containing protein